MTRRYLSGRGREIGRAVPLDIDTADPFAYDGAMVYGGDADDSGVAPPDIRFAHDGQFYRILTADPSSAGQPLQAVSSAFTVTVHEDPGEAADFTSLRDALRYCAGFYKPPEFTDVFGTILIKSGHVVRDQTFLSGSDLGWVIIQSEDYDVLVDETALSTDPFGGGQRSVFEFSAMRCPILWAHFVSDKSQQPHGAYTQGMLLSNGSVLSYHPDDSLVTEGVAGDPNKPYGFSGFDTNLTVGGGSSATLRNGAKFTDAGRDYNASVGSGSQIFLSNGADLSTYKHTAAIKVSGLSTAFITGQQSYLPVDFRKDPAAPASGLHDVLLVGRAGFGARGPYFGTVNVKLDTVSADGVNRWYQDLAESTLETELFRLCPLASAAVLPDARLYRGAWARVLDDGSGQPALMESDGSAWNAVSLGGTAAPSAPTYTDNGDGTFTLS